VNNLFYVALVVLSFLGGCKEQVEPKPVKASYDFRAGEYYDYYQKKDSAFYYYNRVIQNSSDSLEKATAYFKMGLWQLEAGDYYSAQESLLFSIKTLDEKDTSHYRNISASYNSLANASLNLRDYESSIRNYNLAFGFAIERDSRLYILNNLGVAYQKKEDYEKAITTFDSAIAQSTTDTSLKAMLISNAERTKWLADPSFFPLPGFMTALELRKLIKDSLGMNASFAHLSDYYTKSRPDSALYYALERLRVAETLDDPNDRLEALNQLIKVSPSDQTKGYVGQYLKLDDSLTNVNSRDRNQFVLIKFDAEKSKADNLLLEKHVSRQKLIIIIIAVGAITILFIVWFWSRNRRRRIKSEAEKAIQQSKLQTSQKVHDVVANGLYRIMNELEHKEDIEKEVLLDRIELLYEKSRNISYEDTDIDYRVFRQPIHQLINSFNTVQTTVTVIGNQEAFWDMLMPSQKHELELIIEEMMVNMQKHSRATEVVICFKHQHNKAYIQYTDNGVGFSMAQKAGNGLRSTVNRTKSINGEVNFGKSDKGGASILISFPLEFISL
jgi:tetratricopeptide (TPR) repeat protein